MRLLLALLTLFAGPAFAQIVTDPAQIALVCAYNSAVPAPVSGQYAFVQCDSAGKLITSGGGASGLTINSTTISGASAGQFLYSDGSLLQATTVSASAKTALGNATNAASGVVALDASGNITLPSTGGGKITGKATGASTLTLDDANGAALAYGTATVINDGTGAIFKNGATKYWKIGTANFQANSLGQYAFSSSSSDATASLDTGVSRVSANVIAFGNGTQGDKSATVQYAWRTWDGQARVSSNQTYTSTTALADVSGLSVTVVAGKTYSFRAYVPTTSNVGGGIKVAIGGTATATSIVYDATIMDGGTLNQPARATALATAMGVTAVTAALIRIDGTITVNAGGTLTVQAAQNASNGSATTVLAGASLIVEQF